MNAYFPLKGEKWFYNLPIKEFSDMLFFYCDKNDNVAKKKLTRDQIHKSAIICLSMGSNLSTQ